jgi:hypothetical protein
MKSMLARFVCRILAASMVVLPFQAHAGLIGTDRAASATLATNAVSRSELAVQLGMLGLAPEAASERVAALTDTEVASLAGQIEERPAGGSFLMIAVLAFLLWRFTASDQAKAEAAARDKAAKPAAKPVPEKK